MERKKFTVEVTRCYIVTDSIEVEAFSKQEAKDKAVEISNNKDYTGKLDVDSITAEVFESAVQQIELSDYLKSSCRSWEQDCDNEKDTLSLANFLQERFEYLPFDKILQAAKDWTGYKEPEEE